MVFTFLLWQLIAFQRTKGRDKPNTISEVRHIFMNSLHVRGIFGFTKSFPHAFSLWSLSNKAYVTSMSMKLGENGWKLLCRFGRAREGGSWQWSSLDDENGAQEELYNVYWGFFKKGQSLLSPGRFGFAAAWDWGWSWNRRLFQACFTLKSEEPAISGGICSSL